MKTDVCITIDTEFALAGTFTDPARFAPVGAQHVRCDIDGYSHGLGFMLSVFAEHGITATFFVEALNHFYFGDGPMRTIAREIVKAGHDVQLHLHPAWTYFREPAWRERLKVAPPNDSFVGRSQDETEELIALGLATFARWGLPRPVALRTGGLHVDAAVYRAMRAQALPLASNIGLAVYRPAADALQLYGGLHRIDGVVEAPVLTYLRFAGRANEKTLTLTGTSWTEMESLLSSAHRRRLSPVVILTHPHEFVKFRGNALWRDRPRPNRLNQERLRKLCAFLARERDRYDAVTFAERAPLWQRVPATDNPRLGVPLLRALRGIAENGLNDLWPT
jgi:hypothetical protein